MLDLQFEPFSAVIRAGKLDLTSLVTGTEKEDLVLVSSDYPRAFNVVDAKGMDAIQGQLEAYKDTPEGRARIYTFYSHCRTVRAKEIGFAICEILHERRVSVPVLVEPMRFSVRITLLPDGEKTGEAT